MNEVEADIEIAVTLAVRKERDKCKQDACCYCAGHCPPYHRTPAGPNDAGNWVHLGKIGPGSQLDPVLCMASAIFAREKFELAMGHGH